MDVVHCPYPCQLIAPFQILGHALLLHHLRKHLIHTKSLGEQAEREFLAYHPNDDPRSFAQLYGVTRLKSSYIPSSSQICISTIQRMYSILSGEELNDAAEETPFGELTTADVKTPKVVLYNEKYPPEYFDCMDDAVLQVDHRIPYEIGGEHDEKDIDYFMLLSPSANRAKSWTCEHCTNWERKERDFCLHCFWAHPEEYDHVAGRAEKVISIIFTGDEIEDYNKLIRLSGEETAQTTLKRILNEYLK